MAAGIEQNVTLRMSDQGARDRQFHHLGLLCRQKDALAHLDAAGMQHVHLHPQVSSYVDPAVTSLENWVRASRRTRPFPGENRRSGRRRRSRAWPWDRFRYCLATVIED